MRNIFLVTCMTIALHLVLFGQHSTGIEFYCPDDWEGDLDSVYLKGDKDYFGIYEYEKYRQTSILRQYTGRDSVLEGPYGKWRKLEYDSSSPTFIIQGVGLKVNSIVPGVHFNRQRIYPGQSFFITIGEGYYVLYATGTPVLEQELKNKSANPFSAIKDYKLILRFIKDKTFKEQVIFNQEIHAWPSGGYEGGFSIIWMGDLDGDNALDILLTNSTDYRSWENILFMGIQGKDTLLKKNASYTAGIE